LCHHNDFLYIFKNEGSISRPVEKELWQRQEQPQPASGSHTKIKGGDIRVAGSRHGQADREHPGGPPGPWLGPAEWDQQDHERVETKGSETDEQGGLIQEKDQAEMHQHQQGSDDEQGDPPGFEASVWGKNSFGDHFRLLDS
jgi:hypothetical protein